MGQGLFKLVFQSRTEPGRGMEDQVAAKGKEVAHKPVVYGQAGMDIKAAPGQRGDLVLKKFVVDAVSPVFENREVERGHGHAGLFGKGDGGIGLKAVLQHLQVLDAEQLEDPVILPCVAVGLKVPAVSFKQELDGVCGALAFLSVGAPVGKMDGAAGENGVFQLVEALPVLDGAAPACKVYLDPVLLVLFEKGSQPGEHTVRVGVFDGLEALKGCENFVLLGVAQDGFIQGVAVHEGDAAVFAHVGVNGNPAQAQAVNVPVNGADRDLEVVSQLAGGHLSSV